MGAVAMCVNGELCYQQKDEGPVPPDRVVLPNPNSTLKESEAAPATPTTPTKEGKAGAEGGTPGSGRRKSWLPDVDVETMTGRASDL